MVTNISIVGMGPRGLSFLSALSSLDNHCLRQLCVHIINQGTMGCGVHSPQQPMHFLMNTVAGEVTVFDPVSKCIKGPTLAEWMNVSSDTYVPRQKLGEYLSHAYTYIKNKLSNIGVVINEYMAEATDIYDFKQSGYVIHLDDNRTVYTQHVVIATGHTRAQASSEDRRRHDFIRRRVHLNPHLAYIQHSDSLETLNNIDSNCDIGLEGMGLSALDITAHLTQGRGGTFEYLGYGDAIYHSSGKEPRITVFSRSGKLLWARARRQKPLDQPYKANFLNRDTIASLKEQHRPLNFKRTLLPLLLKELKHASNQAGHHLSESTIHALLFSHGPPSCIPNDIDSFMKMDLDRAVRGNVCDPIKSLTDCLRDLRNELRQLVQFDTLDSPSKLYFWEHVAPRINHLSGGAPWYRTSEWRALIKANILTVIDRPACCGYDPARDSHFTIVDTTNNKKIKTVDAIVKTRVDKVQPNSSNSLLLKSLLTNKLACSYTLPGNKESGLVISPSGRLNSPRSRHGIYALGPPTEGCRYFTNILGSPIGYSSIFSDAQSVVDDLSLQLPRTGSKDNHEYGMG